MTKKIYMLPIVVSAFLSGRIADYLATYMLSVHNSVPLQIIEIVVGGVFVVAGLFLGIRKINLFFKNDDSTNLKMYATLMWYSTIVGFGTTWLVDGITTLVLRKFL